MGFASAMGASSTSGGIGKKELSAKAISASAQVARGLWAREMVQS